MRNIYFNDKKCFQEIKKNHFIFPDFSSMHRCVCGHAHYMNSSQEKQLIGCWAKLYTSNILLLTKNCRNGFFCLPLQETQISFNHDIQLWCGNFYIEGQSCVDHPHILCIFNIDPPKSSLLENCTPPPSNPPVPHHPRDVINDRSLTCVILVNFSVR